MFKIKLKVVLLAIGASMRKWSIPFCCLVILSSLVYADETYSYNQSISEEDNQAYVKSRKIINDTHRNSDILTLQEQCSKFRQTYQRKGNLVRYLELMVKACAHMNHTFNPPETEIALSEAQKALEHVKSILKDDAIPTEFISELYLLETGMLNSKYVDFGNNYWLRTSGQSSAEAWENRRNKITNVNIKYLGYFERANDLRWNEGGVPEIKLPNVEISDLNFPLIVSGVYVPDRIKDPLLKQQYIKALEKQKTARHWWGVQRKIRDWQKLQWHQLDEMLPQMYSQPPENLDELKRILRENKISREASHRILSAVAVARGEEVPKLEDIVVGEEVEEE